MICVDMLVDAILIAKQKWAVINNLNFTVTATNRYEYQQIGCWVLYMMIDMRRSIGGCDINHSAK